MSRIQLFFKHATELVGSNDDGLIILTDAFETHQIAVPSDVDSIQWFAKWRRNDPLRERHLPDLLVKVILQNGIKVEVDIDGISDGKFIAVLTNKETLEQYPIDMIDAIELARISGNAVPLLMDSALYAKLSTPYDATATGVALPVNTISDSMLQKALDKAIKDENYELASKISEEMKTRKKDRDSESASAPKAE